MDTFTELRLLADDLTDLGDTATTALVRKAVDRFSAWNVLGRAALHTVREGGR